MNLRRIDLEGPKKAAGLTLRDISDLKKALNHPLPGESPEGLERLASDDEARTEEGLVELRSPDDKITHKHIDELAPEERTARVAVEGARVEWITERARTRRSH